MVLLPALAALGVAWLSSPLCASALKVVRAVDYVVRKDADYIRTYSFDQFVKDYDRKYTSGTEEWAKRQAIFKKNIAEISDFQAQQDRTYNKGINKFLDYTEAEHKSMKGYTGRRKAESSVSRVADTEQMYKKMYDDLPPAAELKSFERGMTDHVRDQVGCGSCWAFSATSVLESHLAANESLVADFGSAVRRERLCEPFLCGEHALLSTQALVSCTPNPRHCGGRGACDGATCELAYDLVKEKGLPLMFNYPYMSIVGNEPKCNNFKFKGLRIGIDGYETLPSNKQAPVLEALVRTGGAIAVAVAANGWAFYTDGVIDGTDYTVNHAVTLVGFKKATEEKTGYYRIKNSWGKHWGEKGYIRVKMYNDDEKRCGWDFDTHIGLACDGDPDKAWVCGTAGVLYDPLYPKGVHIRDAEGAYATAGHVRSHVPHPIQWVADSKRHTDTDSDEDKD